MKILSILLGALLRIHMPKISVFAMIDRESKFDRTAKLNRFTKVNNSSVGRYTYVGSRTTLQNVDIGSFSSISWGCYIGLASHELGLISTSPIFTEKKNGTGTTWVDVEPSKITRQRTIVGSDVWIGAGCTILEGVQVGHGAILAAGAIVTTDVQPYSVVGGVPARIIRFRFSKSVFTSLLKSKWWNAPTEDIRKNLYLFQKPEPTVEDIAQLANRK